MKKVFLYSILCFFHYLACFAGEKTEDFLANLESLVETLEAGTSMTREQKNLLLSDLPQYRWENFLALNYKDRRVQRLKELIKGLEIPENKKSQIKAIISARGRLISLENICYEGGYLPPLLPEKEWAKSFHAPESPLSKEEQLAIVRRFADSVKKYLSALKSERGREVDFILPYFRELINRQGDVFALRPPKERAEQVEIAELFLASSDSMKEVAKISDDHFFSAGKDLYQLSQVELDRFFDTDSYILDYALLKHREEVLKKRKN